MKYSLIRQHANEFSVKLMCRMLGVAPSGYYAWRNRPQNAWERRRAEVGKLIAKLFEKTRGVYGSPRMKAELEAIGHVHSKNYVARIMKEQRLQAKMVKRFRKTTDSAHRERVYRNCLNRNFTAQRVNETWVGDITYIWTQEGWMYLSVFLDLYSRRVVGWCLQDHLNDELVLRALRMAIQQRKPEEGLIIHTDRGVQYTSRRYRGLLEQIKAIGSMSRKGDCWDNAVAESFFGTIKREHIAFERYRTKAEAKTDIFEYIEVFYNRQRRHSTIGNVAPARFEMAA